jgi:hypothetical protein
MRLPRRLRLLAMTSRKGLAMTSKRGPFHNSPDPSDPSTSLRTGLNKATVRHEAEASHYIRNSPNPSYLKRGTQWYPSGVLLPGGRICVDGGAGM